MSTFLRRFLQRSAQRVDRSARGTIVPAGIEPPRPGETRKPTARERTLMRRRLRSLRRRREALAREVGELSLETSHRENGGAPGRFDGRRQELEQVDAEMRALASALDELKTLDELVASGVSARCPSCGELVARRERYCVSCGAQLVPSGHEPDTHVAAPADAGRAASVRGASSGRSTTRPAR